MSIWNRTSKKGFILLLAPSLMAGAIGLLTAARSQGDQVREYIYVGPRVLASVDSTSSPPPPTATVTPTASATATPSPTGTPSPSPTATSTPLPQGTVLLLTGPGLSADDNAMSGHLASLGYAVVALNPCTSTGADANGKVLVIIGNSVDPQCFVNNNFQFVAVPMLVSKAAVLPKMALTHAQADFGWGTIANQTQVTITDSSSPLVAGLGVGTVTVVNAPALFTWGNTNANGATAAVLGGYGAVISYTANAAMYGGVVAPARRVGAFWGDGAPSQFNANGWKLFDASLLWLRSIVVTPTATSRPTATTSPTATLTPTATSTPVPTATATSTPRGNVQFVVNPAIPGVPISADDSIVLSHLTQMGFSVSLYRPSPPLQTAPSLNGVVLVVMSHTMSSSIAGVYKSAAVPILVYNPTAFSELDMTTSAGVSSAPQGSISIITPLVGGLMGMVPISSPPGSLTWGSPGPSAITVATLVGADTQSATMFAYPQGVLMASDTTAPARRVGWLFNYGAPAHTTTAGWTLFDAAVNWATGVIQ